MLNIKGGHRLPVASGKILLELHMPQSELLDSVRPMSTGFKYHILQRWPELGVSIRSRESSRGPSLDECFKPRHRSVSRRNMTTRSTVLQGHAQGCRTWTSPSWVKECIFRPVVLIRWLTRNKCQVVNDAYTGRQHHAPFQYSRASIQDK